MIKGIVFDWDGVVIDSSRQHEKSWELLAEEEKKPLPADHFKIGFGRKNQWIIPELLQWTRDPAEISRLSGRKEYLYRLLLKEDPISLIPGVTAFLQALQAAGIPCAVGSSTPRINLETAFDLLGFRDYFAASVCAEDVNEGKPSPDVFLKAAEKLGISPANCLVFEDAPPGIQAARKANMAIIALGTSHPAESLKAADRTIPDFVDFSVDELLYTQKT